MRCADLEGRMRWGTVGLLVSMVVVVAVVTYLAAFAEAPAVSGAGRMGDDTVDARVIRVIDGDTLVVQVHVRLENIDAPETMTQFACGGAEELALGTVARDAVTDLVNGRDVVLVNIAGPDPFGRLLAQVQVGGQDVGQWLLNHNLARDWPDGEEFWCE